MLPLHFLFIYFLIENASARRTFFQGRRLEKHGSLGEPNSQGLETSANISTEWFDQKLNHFNPVDQRTWKQRYYVNNEFFDGKSNGPVFLQIGGEGEASIEWMQPDNPWIKYAKRYNALCFLVEHRYYGKSRPTKDLSTKNLQYLTSQQALADLATFIAAINAKYRFSSDVKWIVFGGSYPGSLAAWMRAKYPYLVHGAMSASGPLLAEVDFQEYFQVVEESLRTYSDDCVVDVKEAFKEVDLLMRTGKGRKQINKLFKACNPNEEHLKDKSDISTLYDTLAGNFADVVQYNKDNRKHSKITIDDICDIMTNQSLGTPVTRLAAVNTLVGLQDQDCLNYTYDYTLQTMRNDSWDNEAAAGRSWTYQTCTEFGFFQSSSQTDHMFGNQFPVDYYIQMCEDVFGPRYNETFLDKATVRTNTLYGALDIQATNVVFVHGSIDPWHALGITKTREQGAPAIYIEGAAHCANMYPPRESDLPQLQAARVQIEQLIGTWLDR